MFFGTLVLAGPKFSNESEAILMTDLHQLQFPLGEFDIRADVTPESIPRLIDQIAEAPAQLRKAVEGLGAEQLDLPYRPEGWSSRQVVHHLVDSHMNSVIRMKLALTEDEPVIKPYHEERWAELADSRSAPVEPSLELLRLIHDRWVLLLRSIPDEALDRCFRHPEMGKVSLRIAIAFYAWHGRHHIAHITRLREREGW